MSDKFQIEITKEFNRNHNIEGSYRSRWFLTRLTEKIEADTIEDLRKSILSTSDKLMKICVALVERDVENWVREDKSSTSKGSAKLQTKTVKREREKVDRTSIKGA